MEGKKLLFSGLGGEEPLAEGGHLVCALRQHGWLYGVRKRIVLTSAMPKIVRLFFSVLVRGCFAEQRGVPKLTTHQMEGIPDQGTP